MGLDVYLYHCENIGAHNALMQKIESEIDEFYDEEDKKRPGAAWERWSKERRAAFSKHYEDVEIRNGLVYPPGHQYYRIDPNCIKVEIDSKIDPEHYFKVGYWRSSYNEGGIDSWLMDIGLPCLSDLIEMEDVGEGYSAVNWEHALQEVDKVLKQYEEFLKTDPMRRYTRTVLYDRSLWSKRDKLPRYGQGRLSAWNEVRESIIAREAKLSTMTDEEKAKEKTWSWVDQTDHGYVFNEPIYVKAIIEVDGGMMVVYEKEDALDGKEDWYLTALRIMKETIEYVLSQPNPQHYYVVWSG